MMFATRACSVGKELGCRLNKSWHWIRKLLQSPGARLTSPVVVGGVRENPDWESVGGGGTPRFGGAGGVVGGKAVHGAEMGCAAWTAVERLAI